MAKQYRTEVHWVCLCIYGVSKLLRMTTYQPSSSFIVYIYSQSSIIICFMADITLPLLSPPNLRAGPSRPMHYQYAFLRFQTFCSMSSKVSKIFYEIWRPFFSFLSFSMSQAKAKEAIMAIGLSLTAMLLAWSRNVLVNSFSVMKPIPLLSRPLENFQPTSSFQQCATILGVQVSASLYLRAGGKASARQGSLVISSNSSAQSEWISKALLYFWMSQFPILYSQEQLPKVSLGCVLWICCSSLSAKLCSRTVYEIRQNSQVAAYGLALQYGRLCMA